MKKSSRPYLITISILLSLICFLYYYSTKPKVEFLESGNIERSLR